MQNYCCGYHCLGKCGIATGVQYLGHKVKKNCFTFNTIERKCVRIRQKQRAQGTKTSQEETMEGKKDFD